MTPKQTNDPKIPEIPTNADLRDLVHRAQRTGLDEDQPDINIETIAAQCNLSRSHLFDMMAGKPDPAMVKMWTIHRLSRGLDAPQEVVREALKRSRKKGERRRAREESSLLDE